MRVTLFGGAPSRSVTCASVRSRPRRECGSAGVQCGVVRAMALEVGRLVECSQADDRRMIRLVRARPLLYARSNMPVASYYAQVRRLWDQVAAEMGWTVADVRRKWSHVRNSYSRHLRNELHGARTGRGRAVSRWYLADELAFLREHMATDTRSCPYSFPTLVKMEPEVAPEPEDVKPAPSPGAWPGAARDEDLEDEDAAYFQFFRSIHGDYQQLAARKQRLFRRQCLALLHGLLDEEDAAPADLSRPAPAHSAPPAHGAPPSPDCG